MLRKIYRNYKHLLDEKLDNSTVLVVIIVVLIFLIGIFIPNNSSLAYHKSNILEVSRIKSLQENKNIIEIDWKKYYIILKEVK